MQNCSKHIHDQKWPPQRADWTLHCFSMFVVGNSSKMLMRKSCCDRSTVFFGYTKSVLIWPIFLLTRIMCTSWMLILMWDRILLSGLIPTIRCDHACRVYIKNRREEVQHLYYKCVDSTVSGCMLQDGYSQAIVQEAKRSEFAIWLPSGRDVVVAKNSVMHVPRLEVDTIASNTPEISLCSWALVI